MDGFPYRRILPCLSLVALLAGCGWDLEKPTVPDTPAPSSVHIDLTGDPLVTYHPGTGKTSAVVQFIARDRAGNPLDADDVVVDLFVDNAVLDTESLLQADAEELSSSIHLGLVLDASYSMLQHAPPAFAPMLTAARDAVDLGLSLYAGRAGTFSWSVSWFNETIAAPSAAGRAWQPADLLAIPEPGAGTATKLFAAVQRQAKHMRQVHQTTANGPHDHHVMIVLSDGADNYSWFDNATLNSAGVTTSGAPFETFGWRPATVDSAVAAIEAHPNLIVHVLGLGSSVRDSQLQALSTAGGGRYVKNPASSQIGSLFDAVTREFATIQDRGATIPLPPGDYDFRLRVRTVDGRASDSYAFRFHAGDAEARVLP